MTSQDTIELFREYVIGNYRRYPVCLVRGEGSYVWDAEGERYLDFFPGWGCDLIGHCPPRVVRAVQDQVANLIHVPNTWYMEYLQRPAGAAGPGRAAAAWKPLVLLLQQRRPRRPTRRPPSSSRV